jgi:hypothetical protein
VVQSATKLKAGGPPIAEHRPNRDHACSVQQRNNSDALMRGKTRWSINGSDQPAVRLDDFRAVSEKQNSRRWLA